MPANTIHVSTGLVLHDIEKVGMNLSVRIQKFYKKLSLVNSNIGCTWVCGLDSHMD